MARTQSRIFRAVHLFLKLAAVVRPRRFYSRKWLRRILLALGAAVFIACGFSPNPSIQIAFAFAFPKAHTQANANVSSVTQFAQNQPDAAGTGLTNMTAGKQITESNPPLLEKGRKLYDAGRYSEAVTVLQQAAEAFQDRGDDLGQAIALSNLSLACKQLGQWNKAINYITQSLNLLQTDQAIGDSQDQLNILAQTLDVQGLLQLELGSAEQALETWKQAANAYARVGDELGRIRSQINQAQAQQALGLYRQARESLEALSFSLEEQPDSLIKATTLRSLGDILQLVGDLEQSQKVLKQSLGVARRLQSPSEVAAVLLSLGNTERALGNREQTLQDTTSFEQPTPLHCLSRPSSGEALKFYQQAAQSYQEAATLATSPLAQIQPQLNRLSILLELQNWPEAHRLGFDLKLALSKIPPSQPAIYAQINLAQSLVCLKQAIAADVPSWRDIAKGLATAVQQAKSIGDKRSEAYALGALGGMYLEADTKLRSNLVLDAESDAAVSPCLGVPVSGCQTPRLNATSDENGFSDRNLNHAQTLTEQALIVAQEIKAADITYLWQWQLGYLLKLKGDSIGAIAAYAETVNTLRSLRSDLVALNPEVQFSFRDNVEPVYRQFVDILLQPSPSLPATLGKKETEEVSQQNLKLARNAIEALQLTELENFFQEACLQAKPQQIDEVVDETDSTAAVIYPIILKDRLEIILKLPTLSELRHYTTYKPQSEVESILEKLQQFLREPDRINDVKELSQQVYGWLIQPIEAELEKTPIKTLVFVLDGYLRNIPMAVLYDGKQEQYLVEKYAIALAPGLQLINPKPLQRNQLNALTGGVSEQRIVEGREFAPLENVELELERIQSEVPKSEELVNQSFTKTNLQNQIDSVPFNVIHLATHGEFSSNAEETFILTWEQLLKAKDFDNLLRLREQSESGAIELLVLSACQTAAGDKRAALGLAGIAVRAGARSTLATLWSVEDQSTAELMSRFYQELTNPLVTKAEALRRAQLALLANDETPRFWSPYILVGSWL